MIIIGERLNSTRSSVRKAFESRDRTFFESKAGDQVREGASYIDLNAAALMEMEVEAMAWAVPLVQAAAGVPLAIDSPNPEALEAGLKAHRGRAVLNSLTGESRRLQAVLPLVREYRPLVIVLSLDDGGLPDSPKAALAAAGRTIEVLAANGCGAGDILVDPLVRPVGADPAAGKLFLDSLALIKKHLPEVRTIAGLSNVSFGLPHRRLVNRTLLVLAVQSGLDAVICDPLDRDLMASLAAGQALLGRDPDLAGYLKAARGLPK
jgi:cobalamin-dependent methionine synthase I